MKALVFGKAPSKTEVRPTPADELEEHLLRLPFGLHDIDEATPIRRDWVVTKPILSGICGSDAKLVLGDFSDGDIDNPMSAFSSLPHVPGHEVVAEVVELGPDARGVEIGQRVVLNPWLTCGPRGIDPKCPHCQAGDLSLCWSVALGPIGPGVHLGVVTNAPGAWAERVAAHDSMLHPVPEQMTDIQAVLADPFAVSFHAIVRHPPPPGGRVLIYGSGALGCTSVAAIRALYPDVEIGVVSRFDAQSKLALAFGAHRIFGHEPLEQLVEELAEWSGATLYHGFAGLPVAHPGGIDVVYDTIGKAETFEVGIRVLRERGVHVQTGVATPQRFEWTPLYFKELTIAGSNAFGFETSEGKTKHAIDHYFDLVTDGRIDISEMVTHTMGLDQWLDALKALSTQETSGAIKIAFEPNGA